MSGSQFKAPGFAGGYLLLDKATSTLDSVSEEKIPQAVYELHGRLTIIAIAHRLSTISMADQILVLEKGFLEEKETHAELYSRDGAYARFWNIQFNNRKLKIN